MSLQKTSWAARALIAICVASAPASVRAEDDSSAGASGDLAPSGAAAAQADADAEAPPREPPPPPSPPPRELFVVGGEYQLRFDMMSDVPLRALPRTDPAQTGRLGQNYFGEQWLRLRGEIRPSDEVRIVGQADVLWGVAFGDLAIGTHPAAWPRDQYGYPGVRLRYLYLEWRSPIGLFRIGQMGFSWGLGMVANDGDTPVPFGDPRFGDLVRRLMFAARPFEREPFYLVAAGDWVAWDLLADFERRGDLAFQGVLAGYYQGADDPDDRIGAYGAYRWQQNALADTLAAFFVDVFARWGFRDDAGGRWYGAVEGAYARGSTTYARTVETPIQAVEQLMGIVQLGRRSPMLDVVLEAGYASGDSNGQDGAQLRATMDPDHRVGLILFPEVMAAQSARAAYLAQDPALSARAARGSDLIPTNGGVAGATFLFPYAMIRPIDWLEGRVGAVIAWATSDVVDPFAQRALSRSVNYQGGSSAARDLGFEIDASILVRNVLVEDLALQWGVEGGVFVPGSAFADERGATVGPIGLLRFRVGLRYR